MQESDGKHPVVLFDGVCNLCNASVQWLIAHDPDARFRLASLQSQAAATVLAEHLDPEEIERLPDAIVLVDEAGVHTRSTAALRIARGLGFPWVLLGLALVLPRVVRDTVYGWIARNRYAWFGHQDHCTVPEPGTLERFLDADEPPPEVQIEDPRERAAVEASQAPRRPWIRAWALRLAFAYVLIYMAPAPLTLVSSFTQLPVVTDWGWLTESVGWVVGLWSEMMNPLVSWTGAAVFDLDVAARLTGSGDTTFDYVTLFVHACLAVIVATIWTGVVRARRMSPVTWDATRVIARFYLGAFLLVYGWIKVFPLQMPMPGPDKLLLPYGAGSPMGMAWTFIGMSPGYQIFSGAAELLAGYLLFWRRTSLVGALAAMAVMLNVMAINYFFDVPVKLFSTHLFVVALFIAAPHLPRLVGTVCLNLPTAPDRTRAWWALLGWRPRWAILGTLFTVAALTEVHVSNNVEAMHSRGLWREVPEWVGFYEVESFEQDGQFDREVEDHRRWVRAGLNSSSFGPTSLVTIVRANGVSTRGLMRLDFEAGSASFWDLGTSPPDEPQFVVTEPEQGVIRLVGTYEELPTTIVLRKTEGPTLLVDRGFRWINENPFNR